MVRVHPGRKLSSSNGRALRSFIVCSSILILSCGARKSYFSLKETILFLIVPRTFNKGVLMQLNKKVQRITTHEGGTVQHISAEMQLRRSVMSCMLWEDTFYESGESITDRIKSLIPKVHPETVAEMAVTAREKMKLRHMPLFIVREMARLDSHKSLVAQTLARVIQRPDELSEFVALYWKEKKQPLSAQVKKGLASAFTKFNEYSLCKYNRDHAVKLRDVLFLCHAKPLHAEQEVIWKKLVDNQLATADTWEVALSEKGVDKKETWTRLLKEEQLGALALLRNLRNMREANVDQGLVKNHILKMKTERVLPYRFIAAARFAPDLESELEQAMFKCLEKAEPLLGSTCLLVDVSGSMDDKISSKSDLTRLDAACGLAMLLREICPDLSVRTFSNGLVLIPPRRGFALRDIITHSQPHSGTDLRGALNYIATTEKRYDRIIVITDEQTQTSISGSVWEKSYMINVASFKNGVGYGPWNHIDGWSEAVIDYIKAFEGSNG